MATETEVKLKVPAVDEFRQKLVPLKPRLVAERHFEENFVLDYPDGRLRGQDCLMRVRKTGREESVTFKGPPRPSAHFKSREELETQVQSADTALAILERLGMKVWFRYQKYREEYAIRLVEGPNGELKVALDSTPIGDYVELEGTEEAIREVASKLGFDESRFLRESYYSLFVQSRPKKADMVFSD